MVYSAFTSAVIPGSQSAIDAIRADDSTLVTFSIWPNPDGAGDYVPKLTKDNVVPVACSPTALARTAELGDFTAYDAWSTGTLTFTTIDFLGDVTTQLDAVDAMTVCLSTSLEEGAPPGSLTVAPVPATSSVTINGTAIDRVLLIDAQGRVLRSLACAPSPKVELTLDGIASGMYLLRLHESAQWRTLRVVKE